MFLTPSSTSSGLSGIGLGALLWSFIAKLDTIAKIFGVGRWIKRDWVLNWIDGNKGLFLAGTAATNLAIHGTSHPAVVPMTLCMELFNIFVVCCILPLRRIGKAVKFI